MLEADVAVLEAAVAVLEADVAVELAEFAVDDARTIESYVLPLVITSGPEICAPVAYKTHSLVTLNGALDPVWLPTHNLKAGSDALSLTIEFKVPVMSPRVKLPLLSILVFKEDSPVVARVHPPTVPSLASICPVACCKENVNPVALFVLVELYAKIPSLLNLTLAPDVGFAPAYKVPLVVPPVGIANCMLPVNLPPVAFMFPVKYRLVPFQYMNSVGLPTLNCPVVSQKLLPTFVADLFNIIP